ncbi:amino acid racemase [Parasalinivibrio latis]|uniref:aspartate/glutamate racemase family protein n=1 Tax=Parasalinivibrio latis TaxID=2952610 RepID=UPI0030DF97AD
MTDAIKHIGIVGCSAEGAALCYKTICKESADWLGEYAHPEVSMHTHSLADYVKYLEAGDLDGVAALMLSSAEKLNKQGADFLICPDNTIHQVMDRVAPSSPLPWLHIADAVTENANNVGFRNIGILGTRWLVESDVYPSHIEAAGMGWLRPNPEEINETSRIIMEELVHGNFLPDSIAYFQNVIHNLRERGCDSVVLGCTEIPLIISDDNSVLTTLDSTRLLARAAIRKAVNG